MNKFSFDGVLKILYIRPGTGSGEVFIASPEATRLQAFYIHRSVCHYLDKIAVGDTVRVSGTLHVDNDAIYVDSPPRFRVDKIRRLKKAKPDAE